MALPRSSRLVGTAVALGLALAVTALLVYQAQVAARGHRLSAERTLRDYASFADWQFVQQAKTQLLAYMVPSLSQAALRVDPERIPQSLLAPRLVAGLARDNAGSCRCLDSVRHFFRLDWPNGPLRTTPTHESAAVLRWTRDTILAFVKALPPPRNSREDAWGSSQAAPRPLAAMRALMTNDEYAMILGGLELRPRLLVFVVSRDANGKPVVVYGYETPPLPFLVPAFQTVYERGNLLPPSLVGTLPLDSVLSLSVSDANGDPLYGTPGQFDLTFSSTDTLESGFGRMALRVALRPDVADRLVVGGLPPSRLSVLLSLLVLVAILLAIALVQLRREQELAQLRTDFVSGVSHELRTPLAQIRWFSELLHMGRLRNEEERARSASIIDQEARRLTYLVENVLAFSRGERRQNRISPVPADLEHEIQETLELFAPLARSRHMKLHPELASGLVAMVDPGALRQILLNLLDNAAKYGPEGQTITVGSVREQRWARIWIDDEGPGIIAADRGRVWEPYTRLARDSNGGTGGSGIGLSVVRELVELHGGRCALEPSRSGGVRVSFTMPVSDAEVPEESPA